MIACLLTASCATVNCMEKKPLLNGNEAPPAYQASAPQVDLESGLINGARRVILDDPNPQANEVMDESDGMTYGQYWQAFNIPESERYRRKNLLLRYVQDRQDREIAACCANCWGNTCGCMCGLGAVAGIITGFVYLARWEPSCDTNPYQIKCYDDYDGPTPPPPPSYSQSYNQSQNYTFMTQLATALVNKSKME
jgi:hypothetical protein